jgi:hypothetical protein
LNPPAKIPYSTTPTSSVEFCQETTADDEVVNSWLKPVGAVGAPESTHAAVAIVVLDGCERFPA